MGRKFALLAISAMAFSPLVWANDSGPGCGVGTELIGPKSTMGQLFAYTTNTSSGQAYSITSGTSGCKSDGFVMEERKVDMFVEANFDNLRKEMAAGEGEYLDSLATLLEVPSSEKNDFFALTQRKYDKLFESPSTTPQQLVVALNTELTQKVAR